MSSRLFPLCICAGILAASAAASAEPPHEGKAHKPAGAQKSPKPPKKGKPGKGGKAATSKSAPAAPQLPQAHEREADARVALPLDVHRATLANGLRVVIDVDHASPTVAVVVVYDVGARNEERGRSGFAHLFEHMMFQGSANVPKGDHFKLVAGHGGEVNGTTNGDRTNYFEVLPENELALGLWLEADRMRSLDVSGGNFDNQRKVVEEEYRMRVSNVAYAPSRIRREELVYQGYWPYAHPTIGSMTDLEGAELSWVQAFHAGYYGPNNAVLSIAGDVDADAALELARRYFESIPKITIPAFADGGLPEQTSQRTARVDDEHARTPGVFYGWAVPPARTPAYYALDLAGDVLAGGESSRLHQLLVRDRALAQRVSAGPERRRGPGIFTLDVVAASGARTEDVEKAVESEIQTLATRGPSDVELLRARRKVEAAMVLELSSNLSRARHLGEHELYFGDARLLSDELDRYLAVTKDDIKRAVAEHLGPTHRTIVEAMPPGVAEPEAPPAHALAAAALTSKAPSGKGAKGAPSKKSAKSKKAKKP